MSREMTERPSLTEPPRPPISTSQAARGRSRITISSEATPRASFAIPEWVEERNVVFYALAVKGLLGDIPERVDRQIELEETMIIRILFGH